MVAEVGLNRGCGLMGREGKGEGEGEEGEGDAG